MNQDAIFYWIVGIMIVVILFSLIKSVHGTNMVCHYDKKSDAYTCDFLIDYIERVGKVGYERGGIKVFGTEYFVGESNRSVSLLLLDKDGNPINNGLCVLTIYFPDNSYFVKDGTMQFLENGLYYYPFTVPNIEGTYKMSARCSWLITFKNEYADDFILLNGSVVSGSYLSTYADDEIYHTIQESGAQRRLDIIYDFKDISVPTNMSSISITWTGKWSDRKENVVFALYNYNTSTWDYHPNGILYTTTYVSFTIDDWNKYIYNGTIRLRMTDTDWYDTITGVLDNDFIKISLNYYSPQFVDTIRGGSELNVHSYKEIVRNFEKILMMTEERLIWNHDYCIDNTTLRKEILIEKCYYDECYNFTKKEDKVCKFGCDLERNECISSPLHRWLIIIGIVVFILLILVFVYRWGLG